MKKQNNNRKEVTVETLTPGQVATRLKRIYAERGEKFIGASTSIREHKGRPASEYFATAVSAQIERATKPHKTKKEAVYVNGELAQTVSRVYKNIAAALKRFGIMFTQEDGCYWCQAEIVDREAMRMLHSGGRLICDTVYIWIEYADGIVTAGVSEKSLFVAEVDEIEELPLFLANYFKSKAQNGYLVRKQLEIEPYNH